MNSRVGNDNARAGGILNGKSRLTILSGDASHGTGQVIAAQEFHIGNLEGFQVQVIESQERDRILNIKAQHECGHEIGALLEGAGIERVRGCFDLDRSCFCIETNLCVCVCVCVCLEMGGGDARIRTG